MENLSVTALRDMARCAMLACGARGFMRFAREGEALLATDAASRCGDGGKALERALSGAGFVCRRAGALLMITPGDALLARLCAREAPGIAIDWQNRLHPVQAISARLMREADAPLTPAGRALVMETARLCWQPQDKVLCGLAALRALLAQHMREKDRSGFAPAGRLLANWNDEQMKGDQP